MKKIILFVLFAFFMTANVFAAGSMKVDFTISNAWGNAQPAKWFWGSLADWSTASGIKFYLKPDATANLNYYIIIDQDNDGNNSTDDAWLYQLSVSGSGWQSFSVPWSSFFDPAWDTDVDSSFDAQNILAVVFYAEDPNGASSGTYWVDECSLVGGSSLYTWDVDVEGFVGGGYHGTCTVSQDTTIYTQDTGSGDTTPPSQPALVSPANGASFNNQTLIHFIWNHSTDNVGVTTYQIDIASDSGFSSIEKSQTGSSTNADIVLSGGTKYWRVIAMDDALNQSSYETRSFTLNNTSTNGSLGINYTITNNFGNFGGQKVYASAQNWSSYSGIKFYIRGDGVATGIKYYVYLYEDNDLNNAYDDVWTYTITNVSGTNWQSVTVPWGSFGDPTWDVDKEASFDAFKIIEVAFLAEAPTGAPKSGKFWIDEFSRVGDAGMFFTWNNDDEGFVGNGFHGYGNVYQDLQHYTQDTGSGDTTPPTQPALVSPANSATFNNQTFFHFVWNHSTDNIDVTSYLIEVASDSGFISIEQSKSVTTTNADLVLTNGTKYWRVKAYDAALNASSYESRTFTVNNTSTNGSLCVDYTISQNFGNFGGQKAYSSAQDWSSYSGVKFYIRGDGVTTGIKYYIYLYEDNQGNDGVEDDVWTYTITNVTGTNWQSITLPWGSFSDPSWDTDVEGSFDAAKIIKVAFVAEAPSGAPISGKFYVDEFSRVGDSGIFFTWNNDDEGFVGNGYNGSGNVYQDLQHYTQDTGSGDTTPPTQPALVSPANSATFNNQTFFHFVWNHSTDDTGVDNYIIEIASDSGFTSIEQSKSVTTTNADLVLTNGTKYWRVRAYDAALNASSYESRTFTVNNTSTNGSLCVDYTISANFGNYGGQKAYATAQDWSSYSGVKFYVRGDGVTLGIKYYVYLYEDNQGNDGVEDDVWTYTITNVTGTNWQSITLPWGSFSDPSWDTDVEGSFDAAKIIKVAFVAEAPSGAPISGKFYVDEFSRVGDTGMLFAWNNDDEGFVGNGYNGSGNVYQDLQHYTQNTVSSDTTPPTSPNLVSPADGTKFTNVTTVHFVWNHSTDDTGVNNYLVEVASDSGFTSLEKSTTTANTDIDLTLTSGMKYWRVTANDAALNSATSTSRSFELVQTSTNGSMEVNFNITAGYGNLGAQKLFSSSQDWSSESGVRFYVKGDGQANINYYVYLYEDNDSSGVYDDVWSYQFTLSGTNWTKIAVPWSSFSDPSWDEDKASDQSQPSATKVVQVAIIAEGTSAVSGKFYVDEFSVGATKLYTWNHDDEGFVANGYNGNGSIAQNLQTYVTNDVVDTTSPGTVTLIQPAANASLNVASINFVWTKASDNIGVDHYEIQIASNFGFTQVEKSATAGSTNMVIGDLTKGLKYWRVRAVDGDLNVSSWTVGSFTNNYAPSSGTSNETNSTNQYTNLALDTIALYNSIVNLKDDNTDNDAVVFVGLTDSGTIDIYDILGNIVESVEYEGTYKEWSVPDNLPAGVYVANVVSENGKSKVIKLVIVK